MKANFCRLDAGAAHSSLLLKRSRAAVGVRKARNEHKIEIGDGLESGGYACYACFGVRVLYAGL